MHQMTHGMKACPVASEAVLPSKLLAQPAWICREERSAARRGAREVASSDVGVGPLQEGGASRVGCDTQATRGHCHGVRWLQHSQGPGRASRQGEQSQAVQTTANADHDATMMCKKVMSASETMRTHLREKEQSDVTFTIGHTEWKAEHEDSPRTVGTGPR